MEAGTAAIRVGRIATHCLAYARRERVRRLAVIDCKRELVGALSRDRLSTSAGTEWTTS